MVVGICEVGLIVIEGGLVLHPGVYTWEELNEPPFAEYSSDLKTWKRCTTDQP